MTADGSVDPSDLHRDDYDEFQFLEQHARWAGLPWTGRPHVERDICDVDGHAVSYLRWGRDEPEIVLLHGAAQNAHTWDTFAMAVDRSAIAVDLPGHGWSDWRDDGDYSPEQNAETVAALVADRAPNAKAIIGMSLGGLTAIRLSAVRAELVRSLVVVDITPEPAQVPGAMPTREPPTQEPSAAAQRGAMALLSGPRRFSSWDELLDNTHASMPHRSRESLIPGVRHNTRRFDDGTWGWRYDRPIPEGAPRPDHTHQWDEVAAIEVPAMWVRGGRSTIVSEFAMEELGRRLPTARIEVVADARHAVQNDRPVEMAALVDDFLRDQRRS